MARGNRLKPAIGKGLAAQPIMLDIIRQYQLHLCKCREGEESDQAGQSGDEQGDKHSRRAAECVNQIGVQPPRASLPQAVFGAKTGAE